MRFLRDLRLVLGGLWAILRHGFGGPYRFTVGDFALYLRETLRRSDSLQIGASPHIGLDSFGLRGRYYFWPSALEAVGLQYMRDEVFEPYEANPSSYSHPSFNWREFDWIIDGGACEGFFTAHCLENNCRKIFAVEPNLKLAGALSLTFQAEISAGAVELVPKALTQRSEFAFLAENTLHPWESRVVFEQALDQTSLRVEGVSLDDFAVQANLCGGAGLIKLDVEGGELSAILGARDLLASTKPKLAIAVYHDFDNALRLRDMIRAANEDYEVFFRGFYGYATPARPYMVFAV